MSAPAVGGRPSAFGLRRRPGRVPTVMQMEAVECGAASLAMILAHHGRHVTLEELRVVCGVSRDGTKASNLLRAARSYGLVAKGFRKDADRLDGVRCPAMLHWNFNHFVVLEGVRGGRAQLNDPAEGRRSVPMAEFVEAYTGVVLAFEPGPDFRRGGRRPRALPLLWSRLRRSGPALSFALLASLALVVPGLALPGFTRAFVDGVLIGHQSDWVAPLLAAMAAVILLQAGVTWLQQHVLIGLQAKLAVVPTAQFLWHLLHLPIAFFGQRHPGELGNRLAANERVAHLLSGELATSALNAVMVVFFAGVMVSYDAPLGGGAILLSLLNVGLLRWSLVRTNQAALRQTAAQGKLMAATVGPIQAIETVKASSLEGQVFRRWAGLQAALLRDRRVLAANALLMQTGPTLVQGLTGVFVLGLGSLRVMDGALSLGGLLALQGLTHSFGGPVNALVGLGGTIQAARMDLLRLQDVLRAEAQAPPAAPPPDETPGPLGGRLDLEDLRYGYSPLDAPFIEDFSLTVMPGARVALVGGSGSGKSTVGRLAAGLARPWSGRVLIDGRPADAIPPEERARRVAYVDQDVFLFEGTIRENLTLWDEGVPEADLTRALADACMLDVVAARGGRLDDPVAEGGANFSGGQRQRLEIARALAGDPDLLILDEATAALDAATEKAIDDNLRRRGCACLIIAHRLSTIRDCDEIIVMRAGRIVERGTHEDLMARAGEYATLLAMA